MIVIIGLFTIHFYMSNRKQSQGRTVIEGRVRLTNSLNSSNASMIDTNELLQIQPGFRYTY